MPFYVRAVLSVSELAIVSAESAVCIFLEGSFHKRIHSSIENRSWSNQVAVLTQGEGPALPWCQESPKNLFLEDLTTDLFPELKGHEVP